MPIEYASALAPLGLPIGWDAEGAIYGREMLTPEQNAALEAAIAAHDPLPGAIAAACREIDAEAERRRASVLTPGSGQMAAYQEKERQARALLADPHPSEGEYPDIYNEIGVTADSAGEVAMAVLAAAERWRAYGRKVERARDRKSTRLNSSH